MQLINLLTLGFFAVASVSAMPAPTDDKDHGKPKTPACLLSGMIYNGAGKECKCPPGQLKKPNRGKCGFPSFPPPKCGYGEKGYCAKSKYEYCGYDEYNDYCDDNGENSYFCCKEVDLPKYLDDHYDY